MKLKNLINLINNIDASALDGRKFNVYLDDGKSEYEGDFFDWEAIRDYLDYEVESATLSSCDYFIIVLRGDDSAASVFDENSSLIRDIQSIETEANFLRKNLRAEKTKNAKYKNLLNSLNVTIGEKYDCDGKVIDYYVESGGIWESVTPKKYETARNLAIDLCATASPAKEIGKVYKDWELKF